MQRGRREVSRGAIVAALLAALTSSLVVSGCGGSNPYELPAYDPAAANVSRPTASASASASAERPPRPGKLAKPPAAVEYAPADPWGQGAWVERGRISVSGATERAVVAAATRYLSLRVQLSNTWVVDERGLVAAAEGQAVTSAQERAARQRERERRSVGRFVLNVSSVRVAGDTATLTGCDFDATSEVGPDGRILVPPVGGVLLTLKVRRTGNVWRVTDWPTTRVPACDWRNG
jgi:hypothetical protein